MDRAATICLFAVLCSLWSLSAVRASRTRQDDIVRNYFEMGFSYHLILCFLVALHGVCISLSTLKRILRRLNSLGPIAHICAHLFQTFGAHSTYMRASSSPSSKEDASVYATAVYHRQSQDRQYYNNKLFSAAKTGQSPCL